MTDKADGRRDQWGSLEDFIDQFPDHLFAIKEPELLYKGPEGYAPLVTTKQGSWRAINSRGLPVALAWTDWEDGFDVHILLEGHVSRRMRNYTFAAKACGITASWAYTTVDKYIESFDPDDSATSPVQAVYAFPGADPSEIRTAQREVEEDPEITAGTSAWSTGGQHVGYLGVKDSDEVVYTVKGPVPEDD